MMLQLIGLQTYAVKRLIQMITAVKKVSTFEVYPSLQVYFFGLITDS